MVFLMVLNFKQFPVYSGITKKETIMVDVSEALANIIYQYAGGLKAQELAKKIYSSEDGTVELDSIEVQIITDSTRFMTGLLADSILDYFNKKRKINY